MSRVCLIGVAVLSVLAATAAHGQPWLAPGDEWLRSDVQSLADAGIIRGPVTTWPLSWPDLAREIAIDAPPGLDSATVDALMRVRRQAALAMARGYAGKAVRATGSSDRELFRGFEDTPREKAALDAQLRWMGEHVAWNLAATVVADPSDGKSMRADGSHLGLGIGNLTISAGYLERWWGPGWEGSLIFSTNARPLPSLTVERNYSNPFKTRWLSWIGPWRANALIAQAESHGVAIAGVKLFAARVTFKPRPWLEVGLSRAAQLCGEGRRCGWQEFENMLTGDDNQFEDGTTNAQPGNQLAGYDFRLRSPWSRLPVAVYGQFIGEDEAGGMPSKFMGQIGLESWFSTDLGAVRLHAEYSDTTCSFTRESPQFNCGYAGVYPQGFTYLGRAIGHSMDGDSRMFSLAGHLISNDFGDFSLTFSKTDVNRDGAGRNSISATPLDVSNVELRYTRAFRLGKLVAGLGFANRDATVEQSNQSHLRGYLSWQQGL